MRPGLARMAVLSLVLGAAGCGWQPTRSADAEDVLNALSGTLVYGGDAAPGDVVVILYAADAPPPPAGTGRPVTFATVPAEAFTGDGAGLQSAPWTLSQVPDGDWLVSALMDLDGDFHPLLTSNAGATCGDAAGAHLADLSSTEPAVVSVEGGQLLDDVTILIAAEYGIERPAFQFDSNSVDLTAAQAALFDFADDSELFTLSSIAVHSELVDLTGPFDGTDPCDTAFWVHFPDDDQDGAPDPHVTYGEEGVPMVWPRVYMRYLGELPDGETIVAEAVPNPLMLSIFGGPVQLDEQTPLTTMDVAFVPAAVHFLADGRQVVLSGDDVPTGAWSVTVVAETGQTWTLPNETAAAAATDASFSPATQEQVFVLQ
ncbi:MAG: hypothetical protein H6742_02620 [Alphaproteobacteria bacterium]|nr:hypothetical protein [Alphaproteobacteria bacterium]